jgi:hypothetical protein
MSITHDGAVARMPRFEDVGWRSLRILSFLGVYAWTSRTPATWGTGPVLNASHVLPSFNDGCRLARFSLRR